MQTKLQKISGWTGTILVAIPFLLSAFMKLSGNAEIIRSAADWGINSDTIFIIGLVELASIILFIVPRTGIMGTLFLAAYLGGAIATHLEHHLPLAIPVLFESLIWIVAVIRFPELTTRILNKKQLN